MKASRLCLDPRLDQPDEFYEALMDLHRDLSEEQSRIADAKLVLLLSNHIGDRQVLDEAIGIAREGLGDG